MEVDLSELEDYDENDIDSIIEVWYTINKMLKELKGMDDKLRAKMKIYLKEREWENFEDPNTNISVKITKHERETADLEQLKSMLTDRDYLKVVKITSFEKMNIITPEIRKNMKRFI